MNERLRARLETVLAQEDLLEMEPMKLHTTFRIGGPADYFVTPRDTKQIQEILQICREENVSYYIIGNGSNLLVTDEGYRGVIIQIGAQCSQLTIEKQDHGAMVHANAGILLSKLSMQTAKEGLSGLEFAAGIPGTLGGAVTMNAGAYDGEMKQFIVNATIVDGEGNVRVLTKDELQLSYRNSIIQKEQFVVTEATFFLPYGDAKVILEKIRDLNERRREKQPLEYPSAGSTFKRPQGYFAGKLIMDAGLRGYRYGGAQVSEKHCGCVINTGDATAKDVLQLMQDVQDQVKEKFQVQLEPEVRVIGQQSVKEQ